MKKKWKEIAILMLCIMLLLPSRVAYAAEIENEVSEENKDRFGTTSPWFSKSQDNSIYTNSVDAGEEEQDISAKTPGRVEKYIAELLRNIASALIALLQNTIGASLDSIVYGRVGSGHPNMVNIYAFELRKGNPYGVTASVCYALLRGIIFIFLGVSFVFQLAKAAWSGQTAKSREEIKNILPNLLIKFCALMLMPHLMDVALYVRDVLLYGIKEVTGQMVTGGATLSLSKSFLMNAERSGTFVDAAMYLGTVILTIYFVFLYVAVAIDMLVCFVSFPFVCVLHSRKKDLASGWISTVFSNLMTPVIDAVLLLVPLLTSLMLSDVIRGVAVIQLVMCMLIIPTRTRLKALLGIHNNERNGFLGAMAVMTLTRALAARAKQGVGKIAEVVSDARKSRMHGELAEVDKDEEEALLSGSGVKANKNYAVENVVERDRTQGRMETDIPEKETEPSIGGIIPDADRMQPGNTEPLLFRGRSLGNVGNSTYLETGVTGDAKGDALREMDDQVENSQNILDELRMERSGLVQRDKQLRRQMLDHERGSEEYKRLEIERADMENQVAEVDSRIAEEGKKLNQLRGQSRELHTALGMKSTPTKFDEKRAEILRKRANITNFEQPEFKGVLSNNQMRKLYRHRAMANTAKAVAGTVGGVGGGVVSGASAVFLGGSGAAMAAAGGIRAGATIGETAVDIAIGMRPAVSGTGRAAYHAADMAASAYLMRKIRPAAMKVSTGMDNIPAEIQSISSPANETIEVVEMAKEEHETIDIMAQIIADTQDVIAEAVLPGGNAKRGSMLRVLQQANMQLEREIAVLREEGTMLAEEDIRSRRISVQTDMLARNLMTQLESTAGYKKNTEAYAEAENLIREKVRILLTERDKPIM